MERPVSAYRNLFLYGEIKEETIKNIISSIDAINRDDDLNDEMFKDWERKPINLFISSFGGVVYDGLALIDFMRQSKTPVNTICVGKAMSMGLIIFVCGKKRYIGENATLLFHDVSGGAYGKVEGMKDNIEEAERLRILLKEIVLKKSIIKPEVLNDVIMRQKDWYITPEYALDNKLADEYYKGV